MTDERERLREGWFGEHEALWKDPSPRTPEGQHLWRLFTLGKLGPSPSGDRDFGQRICQIEAEAAALAHDRPSGSGLRETVEQVLPTLSHWPLLGLGTGWNVDTEPHSEMCPPCVLRAALSGSRDPEVMDGPIPASEVMAYLGRDSNPEAQCSGYAGDPGASAPRCESYAGHPGRHFIRAFGSRDPEVRR